MLFVCVSSQGYPIFYVTLFIYATVLLRVVSGGTLWRSRIAAFLFFSFPLIISTFYSSRPVRWGRIYCLSIWIVKTVTIKCYSDGKSLNRIVRKNRTLHNWHLNSLTSCWKIMFVLSVFYYWSGDDCGLAGGEADWRLDGKCAELIFTPSIRVSKCIII